MTKIDIGINKQDRTKVAESLKHLLADSYTLYLQTHNFHWNVSGPRFRDLHLMLIAERIRSLGLPAPGTYKAFAKLSSIQEVEGVPDAKEMVKILNESHEQVVKTCREALKLAEDAEDESTAALVSDRMVIHEKTAWMLRMMQE